jgi:phosphatidate cytidylyltransferase
MGLNLSVFRVRALSAIVFVAIMLAGLFWNTWSFILLFTVIATGCLFEYQKLFYLIVPNYKNSSFLHQKGLILLGVGIMFLHLPKRIELLGVSLHTVGVFTSSFCLAFMLCADLLKRKFNIQNWAISILGLLYIPMSFGLMYQVNFFVPLLIIASIWINDTMAYIVGSFIGRTPLSSVSPNKTWEGTIAGVILSVLVMTFLLGQWIPVTTKYIAMISFVAAVTGSLGDLVESKLKRLAGVKDSGRMMPGHGGFLDRFDSILLATPFVWLLLQILF